MIIVGQSLLNNKGEVMNGLSPTDYAKKMGVDRSTVHRWINEGRLIYEFTPSGRKRITGVKQQEKQNNG